MWYITEYFEIGMTKKLPKREIKIEAVIFICAVIKSHENNA